MISSLGILPFVILASSFVTGIISYFILKRFNLSDKMLWSVLVTIMIANTGFMGYPISIGVYGSEGFLRAIFCDMATSVIFLILSFALVLKFGGSPKTAVKNCIFPAFMGHYPWNFIKYNPYFYRPCIGKYC